MEERYSSRLSGRPSSAAFVDPLMCDWICSQQMLGSSGCVSFFGPLRSCVRASPPPRSQKSSENLGRSQRAAGSQSSDSPATLCSRTDSSSSFVSTYSDRSTAARGPPFFLPLPAGASPPRSAAMSACFGLTARATCWCASLWQISRATWSARRYDRATKRMRDPGSDSRSRRMRSAIMSVLPVPDRPRTIAGAPRWPSASLSRVVSRNGGRHWMRSSSAPTSPPDMALAARTCSSSGRFVPGASQTASSPFDDESAAISSATWSARRRSEWAIISSAATSRDPTFSTRQTSGWLFLSTSCRDQSTTNAPRRDDHSSSPPRPRSNSVDRRRDTASPREMAESRSSIAAASAPCAFVSRTFAPCFSSHLRTRPVMRRSGCISQSSRGSRASASSTRSSAADTSTPSSSSSLSDSVASTPRSLRMRSHSRPLRCSAMGRFSRSRNAVSALTHDSASLRALAASSSPASAAARAPETTPAPPPWRASPEALTSLLRRISDVQMISSSLLPGGARILTSPVRSVTCASMPRPLNHSVNSENFWLLSALMGDV
mmetsp:Transcript_22881/g.81677  ORF Transcript_22881/g.81677 Transcript_22881/m.81677 type:complete len:548 (-) Transcript_22881:2082-3725(-)